MTNPDPPASQKPPTCPDCGRDLQPGWMPTTHRHGEIAWHSTWQAGLPEPSFWTGLKLHQESQRIPVLAWRCPQCGRITLYANK